MPSAYATFKSLPKMHFDKSNFAMQSSGMESNWAEENLQTIRTLMERSAIYRRALAPVTIYVGVVGIGAGITGWLLKLQANRSFGIYWMAVSGVALCGALFLVRRQALKDGEKFWSPPTRQIAQAMFPALLVGLLFGIVFIADWDNNEDSGAMLLCLPAWTLLYGLALHSAGFFMPRGIRLFGWIFVIVGLAEIFGLSFIRNIPANILMGLIFGGLHLAYGIYLYFTEPRKNEA